MPVIIPPSLLDVPAIVRIAAHASGNSIAIHRPMMAPPHIERPNGTAQDPGVVGIVPPGKAPATRSPGVDHPQPADGTAQDPGFVGAVPPTTVK
jgi:hypothetical protein